jgi:hypothetical protein
MATLNPSNVVNGNVIQASDIEQLYNAFGTGSSGFTPITGLSLTGSITNADAATLAASASKITTAITGGSTHYLTFVEGSGTYMPKIASLLEYNATNNNLTVTASFATTASHALTSTATQVNNQSYDNGTNVVNGNFKFIAGKVTMTNGAATSSIFTVLLGKALGDNVWINAAYPTAFTPFTSSVTVNTTPGPTYTTNLSILKVNVSSSGQVLITGGPNDTGTVIFTGMYI